MSNHLWCLPRSLLQTLMNVSLGRTSVRSTGSAATRSGATSASASRVTISDTSTGNTTASVREKHQRADISLTKQSLKSTTLF